MSYTEKIIIKNQQLEKFHNTRETTTSNIMDDVISGKIDPLLKLLSPVESSILNSE